MLIRSGRLGDLPTIVAIDNHNVLHGHASFDESSSSAANRIPWFGTFADGGPHRLLVADDGVVRGYACSSPYRVHPAFRHTVELTIYVAATHARQGIGTLLYERLLADLAGESIHRMLVGIALPNEASTGFHRRFGFEEVGTFDEYATKGGEWVSSMWMQRRC